MPTVCPEALAVVLEAVTDSLVEAALVLEAAALELVLVSAALELEAAALVLEAAAVLSAPAELALDVDDVLDPQPASIPAVIAAVSKTLTTCFFIPLSSL